MVFRNKIDKNIIINTFLGLSLFLIIVFLLDTILGYNHFGFEKFIFQNFKDYFADFFNHARLATDAMVYKGEEWQLAERGLSPIEYVLLGIPAKLADYNQIPTLFLNGFSIKNEFSKCIYIANYIALVISVLFFIFMYEKIKINNKYIKALVILVFLISYPFLFEFERGNTVILAVFSVSYFLFNYNQDNKLEKETSLILLGFACALKFIPFLFLILLIKNKSIEDLIKVVLYSILFFCAAMLLLKGGLANIPLFIRNASINCDTYKYVSLKLVFPFIISYLFSMFCTEKWQKAFLIVVLILSLNSFNGYRLLYLLPCIVLFINKNKFYKIDILYVIIFIFLISPVCIISRSILITLMISIMILEKIVENKTKKEIKPEY